MEQDKSQVYNMYQSLKSAGRFNYSELCSLFAMGRAKHTWNDGVLLQTIVHNISIGRPTPPNLVDAIVAEQHREGLKSLYQYGIVEGSIPNPNCRYFRILLLPHGSSEEFGSFDAVMSTGKDWYVDRIELSTMKVFNIAETCFQIDESLKANGRFSSYTIFDNLVNTVEMNEMGTLYLQNLEEQVEQYADGDMMVLFRRFRAYADVMLEMHQDYKLDVRYFQDNVDKVRLQASVYKDEGNSSCRTYMVQFNEVLTKVR